MTYPIALGEISPEIFLAEYWQKKPLLIRQALPGFQNPVSPDELAGLACEPDVESRLVIEKGGQHSWEVRHGPLSSSHFDRLPETHWTLLVQDVEKHLPELVNLVDQFQFIPNWRLDDLMISYAPEFGSVGPHFDAYDVFLLQAQGKRHWQINTTIPEKAKLIENIELRILNEFKPEQDWILEPGDMLYLPPGVAHHGISMGDCMTYSIGFRAPSHIDLLQGYMESIINNIDTNTLYSDPDLKQQKYPHNITEETVAKLNAIVTDHIHQQSGKSKHWIGQLLSEGKVQFQCNQTNETLSMNEFLEIWRENKTLYRNTAIKFLFINSDTNTEFYIDSQHIPFSQITENTAEWICSTLNISYNGKNKPLDEILYSFYQKGFYYFQE